jgi:hypothetical protein
MPTIPVSRHWDLVQTITVYDVWRLAVAGVVVEESMAAAAVSSALPIIAGLLAGLLLYKLATAEWAQALTLSFLKVIEGEGERGKPRRVSCRFVRMMDLEDIPIKLCEYICTDGLPHHRGSITGDRAECPDITSTVRY